MRKALRLQNALEPSANFEDEPGAEAFYSYTVTLWFHVTGDIQYINPADGSHEHAFAAGHANRPRLAVF